MSITMENQQFIIQIIRMVQSRVLLDLFKRWKVNHYDASPERVMRAEQFSWCPDDWKDHGPWAKFFMNARDWID